MIRPLVLLALAAVLGNGIPSASAQITLSSDLDFVSLGPGGEQALSLDAGPALAGQSFAIVGTAAGTAPGFVFDGFAVPLNVDEYFNLTLSGAFDGLFVDRTGTLDAFGRASSNFVLPPLNAPQLDGVILHHAYATIDGQGDLSGVSPAVPVRLTSDLVSIETPRAGSLVGSPRLDVRGVVGSALAAAPDLAVTVNGVPAQIETTPEGLTLFRRDNVLFTPGPRSITVIATGAGLSDTQTRNFTVVSRPSNNVAAAKGHAFIARGTPGFSVIDLATREVTDIGNPIFAGSVDDLCVAGDFLFVLDASSPGRLGVYDISDPTSPQAVGGTVSVPVGPFAGVSAANGRVVVSGGTSLLTTRAYDLNTGMIGPFVSSIDLGIGQPDVLVAEDGTQAIVSTDFAGSVGGAGFGVRLINLPASFPGTTTIAGSVGLSGAGFSSGTLFPANFPIESAELDATRFLTAHGGGLSLVQRSPFSLVNTQPLPFGATNVDSEGNLAFVVGSNSLRVLDYSNPGSPAIVETRSVLTGAGALSGVIATENFLVFAANAGGTIIESR